VGALVLVGLFILGWRVTEIDLGKLATNVGNARHILLALVTPDVFRPEVATTAVSVPLHVGSGPETPRTGQEVDGKALSVEPASVEPGEYVYFSVEGFPPGAQGMLRLVGPGVDAKLYDVVVDADGTLKTPQPGGLIDVYFPWPTAGSTRAVPEGDYNAVLQMEVLTGGWRLSDTFLLASSKMGETILLAMMGTIFGIVISVPLSFFGAANLMLGTPLGRVAYVVTRTLFNLGRSIEMLILAVIMVVVVGIGPFAGVMAIVLHSIGAMGKLYSEAIESIDPGPIEAITATGASRFQAVLFGVIPQVVPQFLAFTMYRWDINVRMSTVIGLVGGGGIGFLLTQYMQLLQWSQAATALWLIAIVVIAMDYASAAIRARLV
jgi:phosphonate transport system permease protein